MLVILMKMTVTSTDKLNLSPANEFEEIAQNVLMIITTPKGSVPLDRSFGVDNYLIDKPILTVRAKLTQEIIKAVKKFEPRAKILEVLFGSQIIDGRVNIKVVFEVIQ